MIYLIIVDLFCGAGGESYGDELAEVNGQRCAKVIACINHDANAIASHSANMPDALHFTEDVRMINLHKLVAHVNKMRVKYPDALLVLHGSMECTNFSNAKGGNPREADSRTLAYSLYMKWEESTGAYVEGNSYIQMLKPDYITIENVVEFMSWGPLGEDKKPVHKHNGRDYMRWKNKIESFGYRFDYRVLNSADFGALTSRKRYFAQFALGSLPISWPQATHAKKPVKGGFFNDELKKWRPVREVLDLTDEGVSIFTRTKALSDKTLERIYAGLIKFVAGGKDKWLLKYNSLNGKTGKHVPPSLDDPCPVISTQGRIGVVSAQFLSKYYSGRPEHKNITIDGPAGTITCIDSHAMVSAEFIQSHYSSGDNVSSIDSPAPTVTTKDRFGIVQPKFMCSYNFKDTSRDIDEPCPTLMTKDRLAVVSPKFLDQQFGQSKPASIDEPCNAITANPKFNLVSIDSLSDSQKVQVTCDCGNSWISSVTTYEKEPCTKCGRLGGSVTFLNQHFVMNQYTGGGQVSSIEDPNPTVTSVPKQNLVTCKPWIMDTAFGNTGSSIDEPSRVITANRKWHYLMNPQFTSAGGSIEEPCFTLIAKMDKRPPYLVETEEGYAAIEFFETDSEITVKIKEFMCMYGIVDIKMRMLRIPELKQIMGFPKDYVLIGTQADQKKQIGNAVEVKIAKARCEAMVSRLTRERIAI